MKPVASNPKLTFEQLFDELATVTQEDQRELVRDQVLAKLHRKLRKLPSKVGQMVEGLTGETVEQLRDRLRQGSPSDAAAHAKKYTGLGKILDWNPDGSGPNLIPISHHEDSMHAVTTGYQPKRLDSQRHGTDECASGQPGSPAERHWFE